MSSARPPTMSSFELSLLFWDHDGFASGVDDGTPSIAWPEEIAADETWFDAIRDAGPALYGVHARLIAWKDFVQRERGIFSGGDREQRL